MDGGWEFYHVGWGVGGGGQASLYYLLAFYVVTYIDTFVSPFSPISVIFLLFSSLPLYLVLPPTSPYPIDTRTHHRTYHSTTNFENHDFGPCKPFWQLRYEIFGFSGQRNLSV